MNWPDALEHAIDTQDPSGGWGVADCCQFVNRYYRAVTGKDVAGAFQYASQAQALRIVAEHGGLKTLLTDVLGPSDEESHPGDVVLVRLDEDGQLYAPGIHAGYCVHLVHPDYGLLRVDTNRIEGAWRCR